MIRLFFRALETLITLCIGLVLGIVVEWDGLPLYKHLENLVHRIKSGSSNHGEVWKNLKDEGQSVEKKVSEEKKKVEEHLQDREKEALNAVLEN